MTYIRNCPICNKEIEYTNKRSWYNAKKRNSKCKSCQNQETSNLASEKIKKGEGWGGPRNYKKERGRKKPYSRNCPKCGNEMKYITKGGFEKSTLNNTTCNSCSAKLNKKGILNGVSEEQRNQMRATKAGFSTWEEYVEKYPKKQFYKREVWKYTYRNDLTTLPNFDKRGRNGVEGAYQIDHIISINEGWERGIPAEEIGRFENLQMITWQENRKKW